MRAIRVREVGDADVLRPEDAEVPGHEADDVVIRLHYAGVNFIDVYHRTGLYQRDLPFTPGMEGAGVIEAVGSHVADLRPGDRVAYAMQPGAYAESAVVPAWKVARVPDDVGLDTAAALMLQGMTAHYLAYSAFRVRAGDVALVHAAAGGVGLLLVQLARRAGARVIGTASTEAKAERALEAGADHVILYTRNDFAEETRQLTDGRGAHVVYDAVGRATFDGSLAALAPRGYLVLFGQASGKVDAFDPQRLNQGGSLFLTRPSLKDYLQDRRELLWRAGELFDLVRSGELRVRIHDVLPLDDAARAHRLLEGRETSGKLLLATA